MSDSASKRTAADSIEEQEHEEEDELTVLPTKHIRAADSTKSQSASWIPLVSPYHQTVKGRQSRLPANANASSTPVSPSIVAFVPPSLLRSPSMVAAEIDNELFDWSGPLPRVPFYEDPSSRISNLWRNPRQLEAFEAIGLSCCLDALLYCFSFLPFKIAIAAAQAMKNQAARMKTRIFSSRQRTSIGGNSPASLGRPRLLSLPSTHALQSKHIHALLQGLILCFALLGVSLLIEHVNLNVYGTISKITWAKLYVLFNFFAVLDLILERVGKRLTGHLNWCVVDGGRGARVYIVAASSIYVLLHCLVLTCQISTIHSAIDNGAEVLGVLLNVKLSDLKDGFRTSLDADSLFKYCLQDVANRFKWIIFLCLIGVQKMLRLVSMPAVVELASIQANSWNVTGWWSGWNSSMLTGSWISSIFSPAVWIGYASAIVMSIRQFCWELLIGVFSPQLHTALSSENVYVTPAALNQTAIAAARSSSFQLFNIAKPMSAASLSAAAASSNPSLLLVDSLSVLPVWLPTFLYSACVTFLIVCAIDWIKHATLALFNPDWLTPAVYQRYQRRLSSFFLMAPKLGLGDQKSSSFAMAHFDFISLPLTVIILRELWTLSIAIVNSCVYAQTVMNLFGSEYNVILDSNIRERCAVFYQQVQQASDLQLAAGTPSNNTLLSPSLAHVSPQLRSVWLTGDPRAHVLMAIALLAAVRFCMFALLCLAKVFVRLLLRHYAKRHHAEGCDGSCAAGDLHDGESSGRQRLAQDSHNVSSVSPDAASSAAAATTSPVKARRDLETHMASPTRPARPNSLDAASVSAVARKAALSALAAASAASSSPVKRSSPNRQVQFSGNIAASSEDEVDTDSSSSAASTPVASDIHSSKRDGEMRVRAVRHAATSDAPVSDSNADAHAAAVEAALAQQSPGLHRSRKSLSFFAILKGGLFPQGQQFTTHSKQQQEKKQ